VLLSNFLQEGYFKNLWSKITTFVKNDGLFFKNGEFTDDTQMALCIVEAILRDKNINPETIKNNFLTWFNNNPPDVGIHTSKILNKINKNPKNWKYIAKKNGRWKINSRKVEKMLLMVLL
jgi:ADP-ribosylglycohydrolase